MAIDTNALSERVRQQNLKLAEDTKFNLDQVTNMLVEIRKIELDKQNPVLVSEVYGDMQIPDPRIPGQELTTLFPHYFVRVFDQRDPDYASHRVDSPEYRKEKEQVYSLIRAIRQCQTNWIERENAKCWQQLEEQI